MRSLGGSVKDHIVLQGGGQDGLDLALQSVPNGPETLSGPWFDLFIALFEETALHQGRCSIC